MPIRAVLVWLLDTEGAPACQHHVQEPVAYPLGPMSSVSGWTLAPGFLGLTEFPRQRVHIGSPEQCHESEASRVSSGWASGSVHGTHTPTKVQTTD